MKRFKVKIGGKQYTVEVEEVATEKQTSIYHRNRLINLHASRSPRIASPQTRSISPSPTLSSRESTLVKEGSEAIKAPLPGVVVSLRCKIGDKIKSGEIILVLESMKMESPVNAPKAGVVKELLVTERVSVQQGDLLAVIE